MEQRRRSSHLLKSKSDLGTSSLHREGYEEVWKRRRALRRLRSSVSTSDLLKPKVELNEDDFTELEGCIDLGFGFEQGHPTLWGVLPALQMCYVTSPSPSKSVEGGEKERGYDAQFIAKETLLESLLTSPTPLDVKQVSIECSPDRSPSHGNSNLRRVVSGSKLYSPKKLDPHKLEMIKWWAKGVGCNIRQSQQVKLCKEEQNAYGEEEKEACEIGKEIGASSTKALQHYKKFIAAAKAVTKISLYRFSCIKGSDLPLLVHLLAGIMFANICVSI